MASAEKAGDALQISKPSQPRKKKRTPNPRLPHTHRATTLAVCSRSCVRSEGGQDLERTVPKERDVNLDLEPNVTSPNEKCSWIMGHQELCVPSLTAPGIDALCPARREWGLSLPGLGSARSREHIHRD